MKGVHLLAACFVVFALVLAGCNRDAGEDHAKDHKDDKGMDHAKHGDHKEHDGEKKSDGHAHKDAPHGGTIVKVGNRVPDFSIRTLDGKSVMLSELQKDEKRTTKGVIVLSLWCSTCHSCRHVEAHLGKLAKDYDGKAVVIALDANADDTAETVAAFIKKNKLTVPIFFDPNGGAADIFGIEQTTTTVVIDGEGVLRYCGQFRQKGGGSAEDAIKAVLAGHDVTIKTTPQKG